MQVKTHKPNMMRTCIVRYDTSKNAILYVTHCFRVTKVFLETGSEVIARAIHTWVVTKDCESSTQLNEIVTIIL